MISVLDHIEHLCSVHDCVIVPGLGAFISQYETVRSVDGSILRLNRRITFNSSISHNDGLLANSISRRENLSYELSIDEIDKYVLSLRTQLNHEGEVPVGRLGYFSLSDDEALQFFAFQSFMSNNEFFGLSALKFKPLSLYEDDNNEQAEESENVIPITRRVIRVAASIALLIGLSFVLSTPLINEHKQDYADLNAFAIKNTCDELNEICIALPQEDEMYAQTQLEAVVNCEKSESEEVNGHLMNSKGNYCLVVASLISQKQADQFILEANLGNCEIFKSSSKYRVYIARGTYNEMISLKQSKYSDSDAWVCKMK